MLNNVEFISEKKIRSTVENSSVVKENRPIWPKNNNVTLAKFIEKAQKVKKRNENSKVASNIILHCKE